MCKLCNRDTHPLCFKTHNRIIRSDISKEFCKTAEEYTGEFPCESCNKNYVAKCRIFGTNNVPIDEFIFKLLYSAYKSPHSKISAQAVKWHKLRMKYAGKKIQHPRKSPIKYKTVEVCITEVVGITATTYQCSIKRDSKTYTKRCKTLEEAQQFKQEALNGNYTHTS